VAQYPQTEERTAYLMSPEELAKFLGRTRTYELLSAGIIPCWLFAPIVARFEDEAERLEEARTSWEDAGQIAAMIVAHACQERVA
jgi:hypothetical protein